MAQFVFFYGTLMTRFKRPGRRRIEEHLVYKGTGTIAAALFDLGVYPAAVPASDGRVHGEVYEMVDAAVVLAVLDEIEEYRPGADELSLYTRTLTEVTHDDGTVAEAWVYFYNASLGRAERIVSGDYLAYLRGR